ncbi:hypothetical protein PSTT_11736 [Puccinia striiformis]|uniref:Uncharacterized protein n=1 Tax=Puccinia striiformis TaxID=27350 RepID=A0A2S4UYZ1_9BASI|nr:hypothetical protein PSTT_11736 [Puccinia striiformis]
MESIVVDPQSPLPQGLDQLTFFGHFIPVSRLWTLQAPPFCQVFGLEGNCHSQSAPRSYCSSYGRGDLTVTHLFHLCLTKLTCFQRARRGYVCARCLLGWRFVQVDPAMRLLEESRIVYKGILDRFDANSGKLLVEVTHVTVNFVTGLIEDDESSIEELPDTLDF